MVSGEPPVQAQLVIEIRVLPFQGLFQRVLRLKKKKRITMSVQLHNVYNKGYKNHMSTKRNTRQNLTFLTIDMTIDQPPAQWHLY